MKSTYSQDFDSVRIEQSSPSPRVKQLLKQRKTLIVFVLFLSITIIIVISITLGLILPNKTESSNNDKTTSSFVSTSVVKDQNTTSSFVTTKSTPSSNTIPNTIYSSNAPLNNETKLLCAFESLKPVLSLTYIDSIEWLLSGTNDGALNMYSLLNQTLLFSIHEDDTDESHIETFNLITKLNDSLIASSGRAGDFSIKMYDLNNGANLVLNLEESKSWIFVLTFIKQTDLLVFGSLDGQIHVYDLNERKIKFVFNESNDGHVNPVFSLEELNEGLLASGASDGNIRIWNLTDGKLKYAFDESNEGILLIFNEIIR